MKHILLAGAVIGTHAMVQAAEAQDIPERGMTHSLEQASKLVYNCENINGLQVSCEMRESTIRYKVHPDDYEKTIDREMAVVSEEEGLNEFVDGSCEAIEEIKGVLSPEHPSFQQFQELSQQRQEQLTRTIKSVEAMCLEKSRESVRRFVEILTLEKTRTCVISTKSWDLDFERTSDTVWTAAPGKPLGGSTCGIVTLDRLEKSDDGYFWNYIKRSIASNPNAEFFDGVLCYEKFDGVEIEYIYSSDLIEMDCDFIEFDLIY